MATLRLQIPVEDQRGRSATQDLSPNEQAYQRQFESLAPTYLYFPSVVSIETLALCNAACTFCPYPTLDRKGDLMPDSLIAKILDDIGSIESRPPFRINLSRVNEPFLDPRIFDISLEINRRFPDAGLVFFSNGTPLNEKNLVRLAGIRNVSFLNISVNDHDREQYEQVMRLPYKRMIERLDLVHEMKTAGTLQCRVVLSRVGDGSPRDAEYTEWVRLRYPAFEASVSPRGDWIGAVSVPIGAAPDVGCTQWFKVHFLSNGKSPFCCVDSDARWGTGDAKTCHVIWEVYNAPARLELRMRMVSRLSIGICRTCTLFS